MPTKHYFKNPLKNIFYFWGKLRMRYENLENVGKCLPLEKRRGKRVFANNLIPKLPRLPRVFLQVEGQLHVPGLRQLRHAFARVFHRKRSPWATPKPKNLHWVFSESSNPHGPGRGALAARASAKYVQEGVGSGNWCLAIPSRRKKQEEIALEAGGNKDFNPPRPTLLTQADQDLFDS